MTNVVTYIIPNFKVALCASSLKQAMEWRERIMKEKHFIPKIFKVEFTEVQVVKVQGPSEVPA